MSRGLKEGTIAGRERLIRRFHEFTNEYPWSWLPGRMDAWSASLTGEKHLAASTIRSYQGDVRQCARSAGHPGERTSRV